MAILQDPVLQAALHSGFAVLFGWSALHKLMDRRAFESAVRGYALVPERSVHAVSVTLVLLEASICGALLWPRTGSPAALFGVALLSGYGLAMASAWRRGRRDIDCGCAGPGPSRAIGPDLIARNALLSVLLVVAALPATSRPYTWLDLVTFVAAIALSALLFVAGERALAQRRMLAEWRRRSRSLL
jgi:hypothetical protein